MFPHGILKCIAFKHIARSGISCVPSIAILLRGFSSSSLDQEFWIQILAASRSHKARLSAKRVPFQSWFSRLKQSRLWLLDCHYVCTYIYIYIYVYTYVCMYLCIYVHLYLCIYASLYLCIHVSMHMQTYRHTDMHYLPTYLARYV